MTFNCDIIWNLKSSLFNKIFQKVICKIFYRFDQQRVIALVFILINLIYQKRSIMSNNYWESCGNYTDFYYEKSKEGIAFQKLAGVMLKAAINKPQGIRFFEK